MAAVKKSVTRLLAERKSLEDRIIKSMAVQFVGIQKGNGANPEVVNMSGKTVEQAKTLFKANKDKVAALISYHRRITEALVKSNAEVTVTVAGESMTVAAAIERKKSINFDKRLLATLISQSTQIQNTINAANAELERRIESQVANMLGADKSKVTPETRSQIAEPMEKAQKQFVIDPNAVGEWATSEMERISKFETEVDFVLSESNAKTEIEIIDENGEEPRVVKAVNLADGNAEVVDPAL